MVFIEPTPYLLDLINNLNILSPWKIDILFLSTSLTQQWNLALNDNCAILPKNKKSIIKYIYQYTIKTRYQLISLAGWSHPIAIIILFLAWLKKIPLVVDSDTHLSPHTSNFKKTIKRILYPILFKLPDVFLPAGTRQSDYLKHYGVPNNKIVIEKMTVDVKSIQNYIDQLPAHARETIRHTLRLQSTDFVFLFVGRLIEQKGIVELLDAFSTIDRPNAHLLIVGNGPLNNFVKKFTIENKRIHFAGWLEKEKLISMYFISDVFVFPTHQDGWGLVINEALAAGLPVIATEETGCIDDLVIPHKTGLIIKSKCADDIKIAMRYFNDETKERKKMARNAIDLIKTWTLDDEAKQILLAWNNAISKCN